MEPKNAFLSEEYLKRMAAYDILFQDKYRHDMRESTLSDNKHFLMVRFYYDTEHKVFPYHSVSLAQVSNDKKHKVAEIKCIDADGIFFKEIQHSNGKYYLMTRVDLYRYCILDFSTYEMHQYIPKDTEPFIWTDILYCVKNNLLAVYGCYWGGTFSTEVFDFSRPEEMPYKRIFKSFDLEGEVSIDNNITPLRWNEDGTIVLECYEDDEGKVKIEKTVDIMARIKPEMKT